MLKNFKKDRKFLNKVVSVKFSVYVEMHFLKL